MERRSRMVFVPLKMMIPNLQLSLLHGGNFCADLSSDHLCQITSIVCFVNITLTGEHLLHICLIVNDFLHRTHGLRCFSGNLLSLNHRLYLI